jgi:DNA polymerase alpha-associated DNA helicase A
MAPSPLSISSFATSQLALLERERLAEVEETQLLLSQTAPRTLERAGLAILNLTVSSQRTGLGGKTVLELELDSAVKSGGGELPEHGIRTGDIVSVSEQPRGAERKSEKVELKKKGVEGVVLKVKSANVEVALDQEDADVPSGKLWLWVCNRFGGRVKTDACLGLSWLMILRLRGLSLNLCITGCC